MFEINVKELMSAMAIINAAAADSGNKKENAWGLIIGPKESGLVCSSGPVQVFCSLPSTKGAAQKFGFDHDILVSAFKNRTVVEAEYKKSVLHFRASGNKSKYSGEVKTIPFSEQLDAVVSARTSKSKGHTISSEAVTTIKNGVAATAINPVTESNPLFSVIRARNGIITVTCSDTYHMALYHGAKTKVDDFEVAVPSGYFKHFDKIQSSYKSDKARLAIDSNGITYSAQDFYLRLPSVQVETETFTRVEHTLETTMKSMKPRASFIVDRDSLDDAMTNLNSVYVAGSLIALKPGTKNSVTLSAETEYGKINDTIKVDQLEASKSDTHKVHPMTLWDSINALSGRLQFFILEKPNAYFIKAEGTGGNVFHMGLLC